jgi:hypothetical protein
LADQDNFDEGGRHQTQQAEAAWRASDLEGAEALESLADQRPVSDNPLTLASPFGSRRPSDSEGRFVMAEVYDDYGPERVGFLIGDGTQTCGVDPRLDPSVRGRQPATLGLAGECAALVAVVTVLSWYPCGEDQPPGGWVLDDTVPVTNRNVITFGKTRQGKSTNDWSASPNRPWP